MKLSILFFFIVFSTNSFAKQRCVEDMDLEESAVTAEFLKEYSFTGKKKACRELKKNVTLACSNVSKETITFSKKVIKKDC